MKILIRKIMFILRIMSAIKTLSGHNVGLFSVKCCGGVKLIVLTKRFEHSGVAGPQCHSVLVTCVLISLLR